MLVPGFVVIIVFSAVYRLFKNARANDTRLVAWARVIVSHTGDGSIDKSRREREKEVSGDQERR